MFAKHTQIGSLAREKASAWCNGMRFTEHNFWIHKLLNFFFHEVGTREDWLLSSATGLFGNDQILILKAKMNVNPEGTMSLLLEDRNSFDSCMQPRCVTFLSLHAAQSFLTRGEDWMCGLK